MMNIKTIKMKHIREIKKETFYLKESIEEYIDDLKFIKEHETDELAISRLEMTIAFYQGMIDELFHLDISHDDFIIEKERF